LIAVSMVGLARGRAGWRADIPEVSMSIPGLSQVSGWL
jgi:hypothetical protein